MDTRPLFSKLCSNIFFVLVWLWLSVYQLWQYFLHYHDLISLDDYMLGRMGGIDFELQ
jgi:hypothetical protein